MYQVFCIGSTYRLDMAYIAFQANIKLLLRQFPCMIMENELVTPCLVVLPLWLILVQCWQILDLLHWGWDPCLPVGILALTLVARMWPLYLCYLMGLWKRICLVLANSWKLFTSLVDSPCSELWSVLLVLYSSDWWSHLHLAWSIRNISSTNLFHKSAWCGYVYINILVLKWDINTFSQNGPNSVPMAVLVIWWKCLPLKSKKLFSRTTLSSSTL